MNDKELAEKFAELFSEMSKRGYYLLKECLSTVDENDVHEFHININTYVNHDMN